MEEEDHDFNPLIDNEEDEEESTESEFRLDVNQRLVNFGETLEQLTADLEALSGRIEAIDSGLAIIRANIRKLRFAEAASNRDRSRDCIFIDACRRRFVEAWNGEPEHLMRMDVEHLSFLGHLLDIPAIRK